MEKNVWNKMRCQSCDMPFGLKLKKRTVRGPVNFKMPANTWGVDKGTYKVCTVCKKIMEQELAQPEPIDQLIADIKKYSDRSSVLRGNKYDYAVFHLKRGSKK